MGRLFGSAAVILKETNKEHVFRDVKTENLLVPYVQNATGEKVLADYVVMADLAGMVKKTEQRYSMI